MKTIICWLRIDQRSAVAAGMLVMVMQVLILGSLIQGIPAPTSIL